MGLKWHVMARGQPVALLLKLQDARALVRTHWVLLLQSEHSAWSPGENQLQALLNTKEYTKLHDL